MIHEATQIGICPKGKQPPAHFHLKIGRRLYPPRQLVARERGLGRLAATAVATTVALVGMLALLVLLLRLLLSGTLLVVATRLATALSTGARPRS